MEQYKFSTCNMEQACEEVWKFLVSSGVERHEAQRSKISFEEVLQEYREKFGEESGFRIRLIKRLSTVKVELVIQGEAYNPLVKNNDDDEELPGLPASIGLVPSWNYKNGKNYVVFTSKKKPISSTVKIFAAIVLSVFAGLILNLLPDSVRAGVSDHFLTPVTNAFFGAISAVSTPFIFMSVLSSICSMGDTDTLGRIGKKTLSAIFGYVTVAGLGLTLIAIPFYKITLEGSGTGSDFSKVLELIYNIVPTNVFDPFISGNALQVIFLAVIAGVAMLLVATRVSTVFTFVKQLSTVVQTVMGIVLEALPLAVFVVFTNMFVNGAIGEILDSYKLILIILLLVIVYLIAMVLWISMRKRISPALLVKKILPTFLIALTTASSAAAFSTNVKDSNQKLGIDKRLVDFGIPLGQVLFKMSCFAVFVPMVLTFAESYGIAITPTWLVLAFITIWLISFAVPPVAGGSIMGFSIVFAQMGIPMEVMGIAIDLNAIMDFPLTAINVTGWQLTMIDVADSLGALDKETLHKNN